MDTYIKFHQEVFVKSPQIDVEILEKPSVWFLTRKIRMAIFSGIQIKNQCTKLDFGPFRSVIDFDYDFIYIYEQIANGCKHTQQLPVSQAHVEAKF
ncbi:MAG TPA: hypothetical protein DEB74_12145 [Lachnospiraceae bacterium]|jgi:hypothetical protein|nr:hypothetical protein [Lachnospiraceae bacterium]